VAALALESPRSPDPLTTWKIARASGSHDNGRLTPQPRSNFESQGTGRTMTFATARRAPIFRADQPHLRTGKTIAISAYLR
jgi:hypothetical protein